MEKRVVLISFTDYIPKSTENNNGSFIVWTSFCLCLIGISGTKIVYTYCTIVCNCLIRKNAIKKV